MAVEAGLCQLIQNVLNVVPVSAVKANNTFNFGGDPDLEIIFTAQTAGTAGNSIAVMIAVQMEVSGSSLSGWAGVPDTPFSITVTGNNIWIYLATDDSGNASTSVGDLISAVAANRAANALISVSTSVTDLTTLIPIPNQYTGGVTDSSSPSGYTSGTLSNLGGGVNQVIGYGYPSVAASGQLSCLAGNGDGITLTFTAITPGINSNDYVVTIVNAAANETLSIVTGNIVPASAIISVATNSSSIATSTISDVIGICAGSGAVAMTAYDNTTHAPADTSLVLQIAGSVSCSLSGGLNASTSYPGFPVQLPKDYVSAANPSAWTYRSILNVPLYTLGGNQDGRCVWEVELACHGTEMSDAINLSRMIDSVLRGSWSGVLPDVDNTVVQIIERMPMQVDGYADITRTYVRSTAYRVIYAQI